MIIVDLIAGFIYYLLIFGVLLSFFCYFIIPLIMTMIGVFYAAIFVLIAPVFHLLEALGIDMNVKKEDDEK